MCMPAGKFEIGAHLICQSPPNIPRFLNSTKCDVVIKVCLRIDNCNNNDNNDENGAGNPSVRPSVQSPTLLQSVIDSSANR